MQTLCAVQVTGKLVFKSCRGSLLPEDVVENLREYIAGAKGGGKNMIELPKKKIYYQMVQS